MRDGQYEFSVHWVQDLRSGKVDYLRFAVVASGQAPTDLRRRDLLQQVALLARAKRPNDWVLSFGKFHTSNDVYHNQQLGKTYTSDRFLSIWAGTLSSPPLSGV